jgi:hypothetical protein
MWLVELPPMQDQALLAHAGAEALRHAGQTFRTQPQVLGDQRPADKRILPLTADAGDGSGFTKSADGRQWLSS